MRAFTILSVFLVLGACALGAEKGKPHRLLRFWNRRGPPPPERADGADARALTTSWTTQPLDHQGSTNVTYQMRYITNDQFFSIDNSPILLMVGGEWSISTGYVTGGHMYEIARDIGALLIYTEHRFYGESRPTNDTSADNLKFLIVDQALSDVAELVKELKQQDRYANSKVIVFGGSYAGNMATWIRLQYPDVINGAVASSGPVLAKVDFYEYLETVNDAILTEGGQKCVDTIREGVIKAEEMLLTENGTIQVSELFGLCETVDTSNPLDVQSFFSIISDVFSGVVQYARPGQIASVCAPLVNDALGTPIERLSEYIKSQAWPNCFSSSYNETVEYYQNTSFENEDISTTRLWLYQTCTEYGYYQTTTSQNQPFGDTFPLSYFVDHLCPDLYGKRFDSDLVNAGAHRTNQVFGGLTPNTTNVISVHGTIDPWHRLGIVEDLSDSFPAVLINGTSHCEDLQSTSFLDRPGLTAARTAIRAAVLKWITE